MRNNYAIALYFLVAATGCSSFQEESVNTDGAKKAAEEVFYATLEQSGAADATKVYTDNNLKIMWNANDRISIYNRYTYGYEYAFQGTSGKTAGAFAMVEDNSVFVAGDPMDMIYAVYPYSQDSDMSSSGELSVFWPIQKYKPDSFGIGSNLMISVTANNQLRFKNVGGYLALKLYGEDVTVSSITLRGNNGEKLSGKATITCSVDEVPTLSFDTSAQGSLLLSCAGYPVHIGTTTESATTFWLVVPPTDFTDGFNITVRTSDGGYFFKSTENHYNIERNTLCRMEPVEVSYVHGNLWKRYTEESRWSVIGSIASTENNWDSDEPMYATADGKQHIARNVLLRTSDRFMFRLDQDWNTNWGAPGGIGPLVLEVGLAAEATANGGYFAVPVEGAYDLLLDEDAGTITLYEAYQTYPGFDEVSEWGVTGSIASFGIHWDNDIPMITDGDWHVAEGVPLTTADEFKFRKYGSWEYQLGGYEKASRIIVGPGTEYRGTEESGSSLAVSSDGVYDILCNPSTNTFMVIEALGGKQSSLVIQPEPDDPILVDPIPDNPIPVLITGWSIVGPNGDWTNDILATETDGVWRAYFTAYNDTEFKWRKDGAWEENYGGTITNFSEPFDAIVDGSSISIPAGFYAVVLNLTDANDPTITVYNEVWSIIGDFNSWLSDVNMVESNGLWIAENVELSGGWKIRKNHGWNVNLGGAFIALGEPFSVVDGGDNINCGTGTFTIVYNPTAETITVTSAE